MELVPYLMFPGNCEEAIKFYEQVLEAKCERALRYDQAPPEQGSDPAWANKIMHARVTIGDQMLMASDAPLSRYEKPQGFFISIMPDDHAKGENIFKELAAGGETRMPFQATFFSKGFGMCIDRFGIPWMINCQ